MMQIIGALSALSVLFLSTESFATRSFTLVDDSSGARYQCGQNGGGNPVDQGCAERIANYCRSNTSHSSNDCFNKASIACRGARQGLSECVVSTASYCRSNTSYSSNDCFQRAMDSCSGNFESIRDLIEGVKEKTLIDSRLNF